SVLMKKLWGRVLVTEIGNWKLGIAGVSPVAGRKALQTVLAQQSIRHNNKTRERRRSDSHEIERECIVCVCQAVVHDTSDPKLGGKESQVNKTPGIGNNYGTQ